MSIKDKIDIRITVASVLVNPTSSHQITIDLNGVRRQDLLDVLDISDFVDYFHISGILNEIGEEEVKKHFNYE